MLLGSPVKHEDVTVIGIQVSSSFCGDDVKKALDDSAQKAGNCPEYVISDQAHNLTYGIAKSGALHHIDICHAMGTIFKKLYGKQADFLAFTQLLGDVRLQYHLTDKAYLLPPTMRTIAIFMNMTSWVDWGMHILAVHGILPEEKREAYNFVPENRELIEELAVCVEIP